MHPPSPINVPNVISNHAGWPINDKGVFYIQELDLCPPLNNAGPNHVDSVLNMLLSRHYIEEIVSDSIDHLLQGDFVVAKLDHPYMSSYYYAAFDIYFIPLMNPVPANFDDAIASCQSVGDDETLRSFPNSYSSFPPYTKRYIKCFVWPIPPPIHSKIPLPFPLSQKQSGWLVNRDSNISLNPLNSEKWMDEMRKWASQCRWGETQSRAPNQPNQIHTTPDTELRRSRTKKTKADLLYLVQQATDTSSIFSNQTFQPVT